MQLRDALHAMGALPLRGLPFIGRDVASAGQSTPIGFEQRPAAVGVGLLCVLPIPRSNFAHNSAFRSFWLQLGLL